MKGTMREATPGTWYLRVYDRIADKQLRWTFHGSRRQAESELARFVADLEAGNTPMSGTLTVRDYLDRWVQHVAGSLQPGTVRSYRGRVRGLQKEIGPSRSHPASAPNRSASTPPSPSPATTSSIADHPLPPSKGSRTWLPRPNSLVRPTRGLAASIPSR